MTPLDIMGLVVVILFLIGVLFFIIGVCCGEVGAGVSIMLAFTIFSFAVFIVYVILWIVATALGIG